MSGKKELTFGEKIVRTDFNVNASSTIDSIKHDTADLINKCNDLKSKDPRLAALAITAYETAAMWAVKLVTANK